MNRNNSLLGCMFRTVMESCCSSPNQYKLDIHPLLASSDFFGGVGVFHSLVNKTCTTAKPFKLHVVISAVANVKILIITALMFLQVSKTKTNI